MMSSNKYDPEDIESLMLYKQFNELYPEEKEFVLRHLENEEEYESMRRVLFEIKEIKSEDGLLKPDAGLKKELLKAFNAEKKSRFVIWLNSLFAAPDRSFFGQRGVQLSFSFAVVVAAIFLYNLQDPKPLQLAENHITEAPLPTTQESANEPVNEENEVAGSDEQTQDQVPPQAPVSQIVNSENRFVEEESAINESIELQADALEIDEKKITSVPASDGVDMNLASPSSVITLSTYAAPVNNNSVTFGNIASADFSLSEVAVYKTSFNMESTASALDLLFTAK